jgi:ABC-2 type transport system permease protein
LWFWIATAALSSLALWIFFTAFWGIAADLLALAWRPIRLGTQQEVLSRVERTNTLSRISPNTLFVEATPGLLNTATRSFGFVLPTQLQGALLIAPLQPRHTSLRRNERHAEGMPWISSPRSA